MISPYGKSKNDLRFKRDREELTGPDTQTVQIVVNYNFNAKSGWRGNENAAGSVVRDN